MAKRQACRAIITIALIRCPSVVDPLFMVVTEHHTTMFIERTCLLRCGMSHGGQLQAILLNFIVVAMEAMDDNMRPRAAPEIGRGGGVTR